MWWFQIVYSLIDFCCCQYVKIFLAIPIDAKYSLYGFCVFLMTKDNIHLNIFFCDFSFLKNWVGFLLKLLVRIFCSFVSVCLGHGRLNPRPLHWAASWAYFSPFFLSWDRVLLNCQAGLQFPTILPTSQTSGITNMWHHTRLCGFIVSLRKQAIKKNKGLVWCTCL